MHFGFVPLGNKLLGNTIPGEYHFYPVKGFLGQRRGVELNVADFVERSGGHWPTAVPGRIIREPGELNDTF
jgi:hypothetical protein